MNEKVDVSNRDLSRDKERLSEVKAIEKKLKKKLVRVNIFNGYVMTTNPKVWNEKSEQ